MCMYVNPAVSVAKLVQERCHEQNTVLEFLAFKAEVLGQKEESILGALPAAPFLSSFCSGQCAAAQRQVLAQLLLFPKRGSLFRAVPAFSDPFYLPRKHSQMF